ncbi:hypothetical protein [Streptomyces shenzhenensis]|uniref:hypothetical protein n=1 Tax=Streptomyces shenzhenensis TaxID=943815 RepID=UPI003F540795
MTLPSVRRWLQQQVGDEGRAHLAGEHRAVVGVRSAQRCDAGAVERGAGEAFLVEQADAVGADRHRTARGPQLRFLAHQVALDVRVALRRPPRGR